MPRDYKKEYREYHSKPEQRRNRSLRVLARRKMAKELGEDTIEGKDIDHKRPLSRGGTNARSNLRVLSVAKNRGRK
ncbi:hypothetical protein V757_03260 [Pelistega indica]|uniref:HNH nuclease domain-containing protein n=1 Tax=Pelistega indica TaxID=1414851 RepID=V8G930_9BURK|nr:HNH endonuclease signature motif containing protein [Pelistega indica]ETD72606.1 hypothetical protein V757_03260 [Pelistega indica]